MYEYMTKPIQKQEKDKKADSQFNVSFADKTEENTDKQDTKFSFSKVRIQYDPSESSQTKTHAYLQSSHNTPAFSGGAKPVNNAGAAGNIVQCWRILEASHYRNDKHVKAKQFLYEIDAGLALSRKLYEYCSGNNGKKHVAYFKLKIKMKDGTSQVEENGRIVICFKWFKGKGENDDSLVYITALYSTHPSPPEPDDVPCYPAEPLEIDQDKHTEMKIEDSYYS